MRTLRTNLIVGLLMLFGVAQAGGDPGVGKTKAANCTVCHGASGEGKGPNPALAGMADGGFIQAMKDYKAGRRTGPAMKVFATQLSDQDVVDLAAYYGSLKKK